jgi:hypothetical protein
LDRLAASVSLGLACACVAAGCGSTATVGASGADPQPFAGMADSRFFSDSSFWNTLPPADATLDPGSRELVAALGKEVDREQADGSGPWINTTSYSVPVYTVPKDQPTVRVRLSGPYAASALRSAWRAVPLLPKARPSLGTDGHLVVWQPARDRLWEFWHLRRDPNSWQASWGGAIRDVSSDSGSYGPSAWPGATTAWGASASSLSIAGGLITLADLRRGRIDHALGLSVPDARAGVYALPAHRTDGESPSATSLPEGAHLRLNPALDLSALQMPPLTRMIAQAAQRYGIFVKDKAGNVAFNAQTPHSAARNPYAGPRGYFEGAYPAELLASFPWSHLQVLKMRLHRFVPQARSGPS